MAEAVAKRIGRLFAARVEDTVDRMELAGSERVMRETIREVDRATDLVQADYEAAVTRRLQATRHQKMLRERGGELQEKARFALGEDRADLAEAALTKQVDCETEAARLEAAQAACHQEETRLAENLAALKVRKAEMEQALADFLGARRDAELGGDGPTRVQHDIEKRVQNAEQAFGRAMQGAGGAPVSRTDAETTNRVAELDVMRKRAMVASRLTALRQDLTGA
jgi:phage shock protein A